jgi:hypothetical protein
VRRSLLAVVVALLVASAVVLTILAVADDAEDEAEAIALALLVPAALFSIAGFYGLASQSIASTWSLAEAALGTYVAVLSLVVVIEPSVGEAVLIILAALVVLLLVILVGVFQAPDDPTPGWSGKPPIAWALGALFIFAVAGAASALELTNETGDESAECGDSYERPSISGKASRQGAKPVPIGADAAPDPDPEFSFAFDHGSEPLIRGQSFKLATKERKRPGFGLIETPTDAESGDEIPAGALKGRVRRIPILRSGSRLELCIDPALAGERLDPGSYTGTVAIGASATRTQNLAPVPITITIADDRKIIAMIAILVGIVAGIVVRASGDLAQAPGTSADQPPSAKDYFLSLRFLVMIAGGLLAGVLVYGPLYADDPSADLGSVGLLIPLAAASFTATLAAKSIADLRSPTKAERQQGLSGRPLPTSQASSGQSASSETTSETPAAPPDQHSTG